MSDLHESLRREIRSGQCVGISTFVLRECGLYCNTREVYGKGRTVAVHWPNGRIDKGTLTGSAIDLERVRFYEVYPLGYWIRAENIKWNKVKK